MNILWKLHKIELLARDVSDDRFIEYARFVSPMEPSLILLSGGEHDCSNFSMAFWNPYALFKSKGNKSCWSVKGTTFWGAVNPLEELQGLIEAMKVSYGMEVKPFVGGGVGYVAYDVKNLIETLPQLSEDDLMLPDIVFFFPQEMLIHCRKSGELYYIVVSPEKDLELSFGSLKIPSPSANIVENLSYLKSNFSKESYISAVKAIKNYIKDGHVYQVNLSQRYAFAFSGDLFELWISFFKRNPAPFYAFFNDGEHSILCTSMERFLFMEDGIIETRPIKGTRPRGQTKEEDDLIKKDLLSHPKDDAELSMIVDLLRNDLGKICEAGSVVVSEHKRIESYQNVHHLISVVQGLLLHGVSFGEILKATFPGGSITGCPKIRAMEIIDELEPHSRHIYTGSIGYWGFHKRMDLNIAIRTMIVKKNTGRGKGFYKAFLSVGGGVVFDSEPELEYEETLHKGRTFFEVLRSFC